MAEWSDAIAEARASAPAREFTLETIELIHAAFVDANNMPDSIRGVLDEQPWNLQLEANAPLKGGQTVTFDPIAVDVILPSQEEDKLGESRIGIDNVPRKYLKQLDLAVGVRSSALLIYREWIAVQNTETGEYSVSGPPDFVLGNMTIRSVNVTPTRIEATGVFRDLLNQKVPRLKFTRETYPSLFSAVA